MLFSPTTVKPDIPLVNNFPQLPIYLNYNNPGENDHSKFQYIKMVPNPDENSIRVLGVYIDNKLSLKDHIKVVHGKVARAIFTIKQMKNLLDKKHLKLLASAYIRSHIEYCSNLFTICNKGTINPLTIMLKKAIRLITGNPYRAHTVPLFRQEDILPVPETIKYNALLFMHTFVYYNAPSSFNEIWRRIRDHVRYALRNPNDIYLLDVRLRSYDNHPLFFFPKLWNDLPFYLKDIRDIVEFKSELKIYLLNMLEPPLVNINNPN